MLKKYDKRKRLDMISLVDVEVFLSVLLLNRSFCYFIRSNYEMAYCKQDVSRGEYTYH